MTQGADVMEGVVFGARKLAILVALEGQADEPLLAAIPAAIAEVRFVGRSEAVAALALRTYDVIISRWNEAWNWWLQRNSPTPRFVHLGSPPPSLLRAAGLGVAVHACSSGAQLAALLHDFAGPGRTAVRHQPIERFEVRMEGVSMGHLVDFSNTGLSVCVPFGHSLSGLGTDYLVDGIEIQSGARTILGPASLRVVRMDASSEGYVIGLTFEPAPEPLARSPRVVTDPTRIIALLAAGVRGTGLKLRSHENPELAVTFLEGAVDESGATFESPQSIPSLPPLTLVDVEFEVTAIQCSFTGLLLESNPVKLRVPRRITGVERRFSERRSVSAPSVLRVQHPIIGQTFELPISDLSVDGIGVALEAESPPFPPGLRLDEATLKIGSSTFAVRALSRRVPRVDGDRWRTGFNVDFVIPSDATAFAREWIAVEFPNSEIRGAATPSEVIDLLLEARVAPSSVDRTAAIDVLERLARAPPRLHWALNCREGGRLLATSNGLRRYPHTFTFQHFALAKPDPDLANLMVRVTVEMTLHDQSVQFIHCNYAKTNAWSSRFFGSGLSGLDDPERSSIAHREVFFFRGVPSTPHRAIRVGPLSGELDRSVAEGLIAGHEPVFLMQANAWQAKDWLFERLTEEWRACGIQRERHVLAVWDGDELVGVSIAELSSLAMNLREDLSSARVWLAPGLSGPRRGSATASLVTALGTFYAKAGRTVWPLIFKPSAEDAWLASQAIERVGFAEAMIRRDAAHAITQVWAALTLGTYDMGTSVRANASGSTTP